MASSCAKSAVVKKLRLALVTKVYLAKKALRVCLSAACKVFLTSPLVLAVVSVSLVSLLVPLKSLILLRYASTKSFTKVCWSLLPMPFSLADNTMLTAMRLMSHT